MYERTIGYGMVPNKLFSRRFLSQHEIRFAESYSREDSAFALQTAELQDRHLAFHDVIYEVISAPGSISRGPFNPYYVTRWAAVENMLNFARCNAREGLERFEEDCLLLALGQTWSYYLGLNRSRSLFVMMPKFLATVRRMGLLRYMPAFMRVGSPANRAFKLAALIYGLPLSLAMSGHVHEITGRRCDNC